MAYLRCTFRREEFDAEEVQNPPHDSTCLSSAGSGGNEYVSVACCHGIPLLA